MGAISGLGVSVDVGEGTTGEGVNVDVGVMLMLADSVGCGVMDEVADGGKTSVAAGAHAVKRKIVISREMFFIVRLDE